MKRLPFAMIVSLVVIIVVMSRRRQNVADATDELGEQIEQSRLPTRSKDAMRELLSQGRLRPSQFDSGDDSHTVSQ